jgi:sentrin-specific protease 1
MAQTKYHIYNHHPPTTPAPPSSTATRGLKRAAESDDVFDQFEVQRPHAHDPLQPETRSVGGMFTDIPHSIWAFGVDVFMGFLRLFRYGPTEAQHAQGPQRTYLNGVATDRSDRKRRAIDVTPRAYRHRAPNSDLPIMAQTRSSTATFAPVPEGASLEINKQVLTRARWHKQYFTEKNVDSVLPKNPTSNTRIKSKKPKPYRKQPAAVGSSLPTRDRQVNSLVDKANQAQGGTWAQKAAQQEAAKKEAAAKAAAEREAAKKVAAEREAAEKAAAEKVAAAAAEVARIVAAEKEAARIKAEQEAARAQEIIVKLSEDTVDELQARMYRTRGDRDTLIQLGSIPIQKLSFKRILASDNGTQSWLDDDAVNAWYNSLVDAKKRQDHYTKSDTNPPAFSNLQTAWWAKATSREGPAGLKRWMKKAGVGGKNILKCERLFLPINLSNHWTLLIVNGTDRSIEHLDSLGGDGARFFQVARELLKTELGKEYHASEWSDLKRNRSSAQDNMSDCGVFCCLNGLAAAKGKPYKQVTAKKMPLARQMMAGVFIRGGFQGDFEL